MPLKSNISKKDMTEEDIKNRFVTPALNQAGWESGLILMEKYFTAGRILVPTKDLKYSSLTNLVEEKSKVPDETFDMTKNGTPSLCCGGG